MVQERFLSRHSYLIYLVCGVFLLCIAITRVQSSDAIALQNNSTLFASANSPSQDEYYCYKQYSSADYDCHRVVYSPPDDASPPEPYGTKAECEAKCNVERYCCNEVHEYNQPNDCVSRKLTATSMDDPSTPDIDEGTLNCKTSLGGSSDFKREAAYETLSECKEYCRVKCRDGLVEGSEECETDEQCVAVVNENNPDFPSDGTSPYGGDDNSALCLGCECRFYCGDDRLDILSGEHCGEELDDVVEDDDGNPLTDDEAKAAQQCRDWYRSVTSRENPDAEIPATMQCDSTYCKCSNFCGDGVVQQTYADPIDFAAGEACDDGIYGNRDAPDTCRTNCTLPMCGDGIQDNGGSAEIFFGTYIWESEACDLGSVRGGIGQWLGNYGNSNAPVQETLLYGNQPACRPDCSKPGCGDGVLDPAFGEQCDFGPYNTAADSSPYPIYNHTCVEETCQRDTDGGRCCVTQPQVFMGDPYPAGSCIRMVTMEDPTPLDIEIARDECLLFHGGYWAPGENAEEAAETCWAFCRPMGTGHDVPGGQYEPLPGNSLVGILDIGIDEPIGFVEKMKYFLAQIVNPDPVDIQGFQVFFQEEPDFEPVEDGVVISLVVHLPDHDITLTGVSHVAEDMLTYVYIDTDGLYLTDFTQVSDNEFTALLIEDIDQPAIAVSIDAAADICSNSDTDPTNDCPYIGPEPKIWKRAETQAEVTLDPQTYHFLLPCREGPETFAAVSPKLNTLEDELSFYAYEFTGDPAERLGTYEGDWYISRAKDAADGPFDALPMFTEFNRDKTYFFYFDDPAMDASISFQCGVGLDIIACVPNENIEEGELCDDGNADPYDGCYHCLPEPGYVCTGEPSVCVLSLFPVLPEGAGRRPGETFR